MCRGGGGGCLAASGNGNQYFFLPSAGKGKRKKMREIEARLRKRSTPDWAHLGSQILCPGQTHVLRTSTRVFSTPQSLCAVCLFSETEYGVCPTKEARIN